MLQYILTENERFSLGESAQMAVEGGCMWVTLSLPGLNDSEIRDMVAPDIINLCREANIFLTIDNRPELARELGLHGVRLDNTFFSEHPHATAMDIREELGPEAIIGVELTDVSALSSLVPADLDFVTLPQLTPHARRKEIVAAVKAAGVNMPVVAQGRFSLDEAIEAIADGCSGVAVGSPITESDDPTAAMRTYIDALAALTQAYGE